MSALLCTAYVHPDLDGVAGAVGYAEYLQLLGQKAVAGFIGTLHEEARFVLERFGLETPLSLDDASAYQKIALVDASDLKALDGKVLPERVVEVIDHRRIHDAAAFPHATIQIELVGAAATLIAEKFMRYDLPVTQGSAILLQTAIISNTLNFKGAVCTIRDIEAAQWLQTYSQLPAGFAAEMFNAKSDLSGDKLQERLRSDFAQFEFSGRTIGIAQLEIRGARQLLETRRDEITALLSTLQQAHNLDYVFLNTIELDNPCNLLFAPSAMTRALLVEALGGQFESFVAMHQPALLRKQIVPKLKEALEKAFV